MAKNVKINGVTYSSVPYVSIPNASGSGNALFYDTSAADLTANDLRKSKKAYGASGEITGNLEDVSISTTTITARDQQISIPAGIHSGTQKISVDASNLTPAVLKSGVTVLGIAGALSAATVSQDGSTKVLSIS